MALLPAERSRGLAPSFEPGGHFPCPSSSRSRYPCVTRPTRCSGSEHSADFPHSAGVLQHLYLLPLEDAAQRTASLIQLEPGCEHRVGSQEQNGRCARPMQSQPAAAQGPRLKEVPCLPVSKLLTVTNQRRFAHELKPQTPCRMTYCLGCRSSYPQTSQQEGADLQPEPLSRRPVEPGRCCDPRRKQEARRGSHGRSGGSAPEKGVAAGVRPGSCPHPKTGG